ncbi:hypothetical protein MVLG_06291 [Microbotryum lychnidis-dioicae p1A1 Lamole]|uniref:NAD(P)-binding protein n=1 Tax=Microbotryum lychnidis-dioicae (strain p1A1 Lamole / MvSl-1064) TaxID=683840 RepID=U5HGT8_USTV1|nr:hypothetical protein MVLG_06291 [Microbotryum lychnidis-dioicae p1A1 Lamole]|eukprot:KDE03200.1 hypothetical protein MVLG_06291 [Microbotryum lychnidis-dioicae p1A1 Lamole]
MGSIVAKIAPNSGISRSWLPPPSAYDAERDMPDMTGQIVMVTGGNAGIGLETVKRLMLKNAKVYIAARSEERVMKAIEALERQTNVQGKAIWIKMDLCDLVSLKKSAEQFSSLEERLDLLYVNAGVAMPQVDQLTKDGYDLTFGTNVLGHYYFVKYLIPSLRASAASRGKPARIVWTASEAATGWSVRDGENGLWNADSLLGGERREALLKKWGSGFAARSKLYGQAKAGNIVHCFWLGRQYPNEIDCVAVHPGAIKSDIHRDANIVMKIVANMILRSVEMGAMTGLWAGTIAAAEGVRNKYFVPVARLVELPPVFHDEKVQDDLAAWCEQQLPAAKE